MLLEVGVVELCKVRCELKKRSRDCTSKDVRVVNELTAT